MRRTRWCLVLALAGPGCGYDAKGQGPDSGEGSGTGGGSTSTGDVGSTGGPEGSSTTVVLEGSGTGDGDDSSGAGSSSTTSPETDTGSTGEPPPSARSCAEILAMDRDAATGVHSIVRESDGASIEVWCEMELDGGGWTLVARSAPGGSGEFGWGVAAGTVGDESAPYSLDVVDVGLTFTEVLIGRRTGFATLSQHAYVLEVPMGFVDDYREESYETEGARTVLGNCEPNGGPAMLRWVGYTEDEDRYFFRDYPQNHPYGLYPGEMRVLYWDCGNGGELHEEQGAVFVR